MEIGNSLINSIKKITIQQPPETIYEIPTKIFIIPYRNRKEHAVFYMNYMKIILSTEEENKCEFIISHQFDKRTFNRGAIKNIGFLAAKQKYPNHYKNITFVFNDIDVVPFKKIFNYNTTKGIVKHFYGLTNSLGGIFSITGEDFENINGFPNLWSWSMEDTSLQKRCIQNNLYIDRADFHEIGNPKVLQLFDGIERIIKKKEIYRGYNDNGIDGLRTLNNVFYTLDKKSLNSEDDGFIEFKSNLFVVNIKYFEGAVPYDNTEYTRYDLRDNEKKIINPDVNRYTTHIVDSTNDWANIPIFRNQPRAIPKIQKRFPQALPSQRRFIQSVKHNPKNFLQYLQQRK